MIFGIGRATTPSDPKKYPIYWGKQPFNFALVNASPTLTVFRSSRPSRAQTRFLVNNLIDIPSLKSVLPEGVTGIKTFVNMEWEKSDEDLLLPWFKDVRMARVKDFEPLPWLAPALALQHVIQACAEIIIGPQPVLVHCSKGENRTGGVIAGHRLFTLHEPLDTVMEDFLHFRGFWAPFDTHFIRGMADPQTMAYARQAIHDIVESRTLTSTLPLTTTETASGAVP
jgi:protein tyrosine/serine phosphatase